MKKIKSAAQRLAEYEPILVPYEVWTVFGSKYIEIMGDQACLTSEGDYADLNKVRTALEWYVNQFDGKVEWKKYDK